MATNDPDQDREVMVRQESALWLGRALSSSEVGIRFLLQLVDVIRLQQQVIQALYEQQTGHPISPWTEEALKEMEQGLSKKIQQEMNEIDEQLQPILGSLDESCQTLENML
jgi:hypothetical protein